MAFTGRIGLLVPSSNTTVETEFFKVLPTGVTLHVARLFIAVVNTESIAKMVETLESQSKLLASADVDVIVLGATAPSFLKGLGYDKEMSKRIEDATGKPATTTSTALLQALQVLGVQKLSLGSAYSPKVNDICGGFIEANGFEVVAKEGLDVIDNLQIGRLDVETAYDLGRKVDRPEAQGVVLACTNWKSMDIIERLENDLGKPVLSTTQVSIWGALRKIGYEGSIPGYGRLLRTFAKEAVPA
ncbi:MAG: aspartate/glutamate racemase family protein [Proteobacteria bacterium]|nr:aspartate/glutamate racemase family protein [Burkholderiales bacterium]